MTDRHRNEAVIKRRSSGTWAIGGVLLALILIGIGALTGVLDGNERTTERQAAGRTPVHARPVAQSGSIDSAGRSAARADSRPPAWYRSTWIRWGACGIGLVGLALFLVRGRRWATLNLRAKKEGRRGSSASVGEVQARQTERYARELVRTNAILREEVEQKAALLRAAAHDLKNPFFGIQALAEIVLESDALSPQDERKIRLIRESAADALKRIDELLRSARETTKRSVPLTVLDASSLVERVVQAFEPQAEWKRQTLICTLDDAAACHVEGDWRRLREAVSNLVSNALKYSPSGTQTNVVVKRCGERVRIAVTDEGPGLSKQDQERMFAPFQRLSAKPTGGESASGLGLYLTKQIVERHEGEVEVISARGDGSTFAIVLPAVRRPDVAS